MNDWFIGLFTLDKDGKNTVMRGEAIDILSDHRIFLSFSRFYLLVPLLLSLYFP